MGVLENRKGLLLMFLIGVIVGYGLSLFIINKGSFSVEGELSQEKVEIDSSIDADAELENKGDTVSLIAKGENTLVVNSQPAGSFVILSMIAIETSGWVAVREAVNETPGVILGAARFDAGNYFGEKIKLLRDTQEGGNYMVVLHADNGDKEFDFKTEVPVKDSAGNLIAEEFFTTTPIDE